MRHLLPQNLADHVVSSPCALRVREDIYVVKVRHDEVSRSQPALYLQEGWAKRDAEKPRHQRVSLLAPFGAGHDMRRPSIVRPDGLRRGGIPEAHEWQHRPQGRRCQKAIQHARAGHMIEGPHTVNA